MKRFALLKPLAAAITLLAFVSPAAAHVGAGDVHGFTHGFAHPVGGLDHVLAMLAVGVFAAGLGGRALWLVPASFVLMMAAGGALGMAGADLPYVELGIAASVIVLGTAVALQLSIPTLAAMALVGFFAIFHGHAHGAEMPVDASGASYAAGFMLATALLHAAGIALAFAVARLATTNGPRLAQLGGAAVSLAGIGLVAGWI